MNEDDRSAFALYDVMKSNAVGIERLRRGGGSSGKRIAAEAERQKEQELRHWGHRLLEMVFAHGW